MARRWPFRWEKSRKRTGRSQITDPAAARQIQRERAIYRGTAGRIRPAHAPVSNPTGGLGDFYLAQPYWERAICPKNGEKPISTGSSVTRRIAAWCGTSRFLNRRSTKRRRISTGGAVEYYVPKNTAAKYVDSASDPLVVIE